MTDTADSTRRVREALAYYDTSYPPDVLNPIPPGPAPTITLLSPPTSAAGATGNLSVNGTGFVEGQTVGLWNGSPVPGATFLFITDTMGTWGPLDSVFAVAQTGNISVKVNNVASNTMPYTITASVRDAPGEFTIAEIQAWVDAHPDEADEVLSAEQARGAEARSTLVTWLQGFISHRDEGTTP